MKTITKKSRYMSFVAMAMALVLGGTLISCSTTAEDRSTTSSKSEVTQNEKTYRFKATVVYHQADGGYYSLLSNSGKEYYPLNLESKFKKTGLKVQVHGQGRGYAKGGTMRALEIYDMERLAR